MKLVDIIFEWLDEQPDLKRLSITRTAFHSTLMGLPYLSGPQTMATIHDDYVSITSFGAIHADKGDAAMQFNIHAADPEFFTKLKVAMLEQGQTS